MGSTTNQNCSYENFNRGHYDKMKQPSKDDGNKSIPTAGEASRERNAYALVAVRNQTAFEDRTAKYIQKNSNDKRSGHTLLWSISAAFRLFVFCSQV